MNMTGVFKYPDVRVVNIPMYVGYKKIHFKT